MTLKRTDPKDGAAGPLTALGQDPFGVDFYSYPADINKLAHAMIFNINVPVNSKNVQRNAVSGSSETPAPSPEGFGSTGTASRSQKLREGTLLGMGIGSLNDIFGTNITTQRKTTRITKTIALYVPETMVFDSQQQYDTPELGTMAAQSIGDAIGVGGAAL